jgi:hypothetical protein
LLESGHIRESTVSPGEPPELQVSSVEDSHEGGSRVLPVFESGYEKARNSPGEPPDLQASTGEDSPEGGSRVHPVVQSDMREHGFHLESLQRCRIPPKRILPKGITALPVFKS